MSERSLGSVVIALKAVDEVSGVMDKIRASTGILGGALSQLGGGFGAVGNVITGFAGAGIAGAAIAALGEVAQGLQWSVNEATDSQQAFTNLATAIERSGTAWTDVEGKTRQYLSQLQQTTVYSDEALAGMVERLLTFGMTYDQTMSAAGTALDLAAAKHMDLQSASDLLGKAFMGNTTILKRYGIDIEDIGGKSAIFTDIMGKLNEQFGGAAQAQAQTYAGIQERLKNATSELGEKIGGMLLPGLASVTEAMIPVVDWFGKGIDAFQAWITEIGKSTDIQPIITAVTGVFAALGAYLLGLQKFMMDSFGPAVQELMSAFKELWDALAPIGEALSELLSVFGDTGNIDLLKTVLQIVVLQIRAVAEAIKLVAPYIKAFADAFKMAADVITPILKQIGDDIRTFLDVLKTAFQGFYNWLVGRSLWVDLWNAVLAIASQMIGQLLGNLSSQLFQPMQSAFTSAMQAVGDLWNRSWASVQTFLTTQLATMITDLTSSTSQYAPIASAALTAMQNGMNALWALIKGDWQGALGFMRSELDAWGQVVQGIVSGIMGTLQGIVSQGVAAMVSSFNSLVSAGQSAVAQAQSLFAQAQQVVSGIAQQVAAAAQPATQGITDAFNAAYDAVASGATWLWNTLTGGSIWTDMLDEMQTQTDVALGNIVGVFQDMSLAVPATVPYSPTATLSPAAAPPTSAGMAGPLSLTIPITVTLDGQVISRQVERRIVERVNLRGKKVA